MKMSLWARILGAMLTLAVVSNTARSQDGPVRTYYVALEGNDSWSGNLPAAKAAQTDGPFRTIRHALDITNKERSSLKPDIRAQVIRVQGGTYSLSEPLALTAADSGAPTVPVVIEGEGKRAPTLSGGVRLTGWRQMSKRRWEVTLPEVAQGKWYFSQLYVNGERRFRPRIPKSGYYFIAGEVPATPKLAGKGFDRFRYKPGDLRSDWQNRNDIEVLPFHVWTMSRFGIADLDDATHTVTFTGGTRNAAAFSRLSGGGRYLVDNVKEALTEPGEWYLDRKTGVLTYLAKPGEDPIRVTVIAPRLEHLLDIQGAKNVTFRGITFAHAGWNSGPEGNSYAQAEVNIPATLTLTGARDVIFENCAVRNIGTYAVAFGNGTKRCRLENCELVDLGAGGVKIGDTRNYTDDEQLATHNVVRDCLIAEGGRIHPAAVGVWIGHSPYNTIANNEIVDFYYTGVSVGWSWGYGVSGAHHNIISDNHIHQIGQGVLSDMGGIYTLGICPGTVLNHNRIHDVWGIEYGGWGIYFDEGTTDAVATNNIVYDTKSAPFHQHYGTKNRVENNILALGNEAQLMRTRADNNNQPTPDLRNELSFTLTHNLVYWKDGPLFGSNWSGNNFVLTDNLYWNATGKPIQFPGGRTLEAWQTEGKDKGSLVADPLFTAPDKGDFTLRPDSPATKIGFHPIAATGIGRRSAPPYRGHVARAFPPPPGPEPLALDFEEDPIGAKPGGKLVLSEEPEVPSVNIRVTDGTAATGKHALKITDAPGQKHRFNPHLYAQPKYTEGPIVGRFALRLEPGAVFNHEWRDSSTPYTAGPSLSVDAKGGLSAGQQKLMDLPTGRWIRFEIRCPLGDAARGNYEVTVRFPGRTPPQKFSLPCSTAFKSLRWWGFVSDSDTASVFYLDDLYLGPDNAK